MRRILVALAMLAMAAPAVPAQAIDASTLGTGLTESERCDNLDQSSCLLPFPNDLYTKADPTTDTGKRLNLNPLSMPRNIAGKPIDATDINRNDGFSPGQAALTVVPGIDLEQSNAPEITTMARYTNALATVFAIDTLTGTKQPIWVERDTSDDGAVASALGFSAAERMIIIRPAKNWLEGHRYVIAIVNPRNAAGQVIPAGPAFAAYRDGTAASDDASEARRAHVNANIEIALDAIRPTYLGIDRSDLFVAWDFTVASERNLTERVLKIRDDSFAELGDTDLTDGDTAGAAPSFAITSVQNFDANAKIVRTIKGTVNVPNWLNTPTGAPGGSFIYGLDGLPVRVPGATLDAEFQCNIPRTASASNTAMPGLYGHGLLGSYTEVGAGNVQDMSAENNFAFCATYWAGMSEIDLGNVAVTLADMSNFHTMADRMQQGFLNFLILGRAAKHPGGFASNAAFQDAQGNSLIDAGKLVYDGNSQGGIMGGALTAISPDFTNAVLGVVAMNYSTLLDRSIDFATYSIPMYASYPNPIDQQVIFGLAQMLWDRGEANGYAQHMTTDPPANTPAHRVLMHVATADHQVADVAAEVQARTVGAKLYTALDAPSPLYGPAVYPGPGRNNSSDPTFGFQTWNGNETVNGSALVYWDSYTCAAACTYKALLSPLGNNPPVEAANNADPHSRPRSTATARTQKNVFLRTGTVVSTCGTTVCRANM